MNIRIGKEPRIWGTKLSLAFAQANVLLISSYSKEQADLIRDITSQNSRFWELFEQVFGTLGVDCRITVCKIPAISNSYHIIVYTHDDSWKIKDKLIITPDVDRCGFGGRINTTFEQANILNDLALFDIKQY